ncbi:MAG: type I methionyl aminopeptidase [Chloroflexi bacterium]|nr:type I methionyl aminopeptidase [Chloroflexota bacterium]
MKQIQKLQTASNSPPPYNGGITIKSPQELEAMRRAGAIVAETIATLEEAVHPGITTSQLDQIAYRVIRERGGQPTFKGYRGFPASICASVNEEIVHGIPSDRILNEGDLIKVDVGATIDGFIGDSAVTVGVGKISKEAQKLIDVTRQCLEEGIKAAVDGARTGDIGAVVEEYATARDFSVVREYVGHGVGRFLHEDPQVPNYGPAGRGAQLRQGMALAIEPMVNVGGWETKLLDDHWTVVTADGSLSAHFEHTIAITDGEAEVLTRI